jgi:putative restriction endonuclease
VKTERRVRDIRPSHPTPHHVAALRGSSSAQQGANGLALCKIHHAAYDRDIIGIRPDLRIEVASSVLAESDGPMLRHGLQGFHGQQLRSVPARRKDRPDPDRLERRYAEFLRSA